VVNILVGLLFATFGLQQNQAAAYPLVAGDYQGQLVFWLVASLVAPLGEEILFRGYLWGAIQRQYGIWWAVIGTALMFAIGHSTSASQGAVVLVSQTLVMGVLLAWLRHMSGSVWAGVCAHAMNNSIAVAIVTYCVNHPEIGCARSS
jgi:membrane protease YdiL (CAAX protease family)